MYLVDTNVWLERLLDQDKSEEVNQFLDRMPSEQLFITDFSFHSIGIILVKLKMAQVLVDFSNDLFLNGAVNLINRIIGGTEIFSSS